MRSVRFFSACLSARRAGRQVPYSGFSFHFSAAGRARFAASVARRPNKPSRWHVGPCGGRPTLIEGEEFVYVPESFRPSFLLPSLPSSAEVPPWTVHSNRSRTGGCSAAVPVETSLDRTAWQTVDGAGTSGLVHIAVTLTEATNSTVEQKFKEYQQQLAAGNSSQMFEFAPLKLRLVNFTSFARSLHHGTFVGQYDNVIVGTWKSETLTGTAARDLMVGQGGNDVFKGLDGNDILIGASGKDNFQGGNGDDVCLVLGTNNGIDRFDGGGGLDQVVAASSGTEIGIDGYANNVEIFQGPGDTIIRDSYNGRTLDFSATQLIGIAEVDAGAGNDTILASNVTPGVYRGNSGDDVLDAGSQATTWLFAGADNGFDTFRDNGAATVEARATASGTVIGINGYANGVDRFVGDSSGDTIVRDSYNSRTLDFSLTQLVNIAEVDAGAGNDTILASDVSPGVYRGNSGDDTLDGGGQATTWLFAGTDNGFDTFRDNGAAAVEARPRRPAR